MNISILLPYECDDEVDFSFIKKYNVSKHIITQKNYKEELEKIPESNILFNLCDGFDGNEEDDYIGKELIKYLEDIKRPFIGTSSKNYYWSKSDVRKSGVLCAKYRLITKGNYERELTNNEIMTFPQIVKPNHYAGGSEGIFKDSKVNNLEELKKIVVREIENYDELIIEEFIEGREFSSLAFGNYENPEVLKPIECGFTKNENFKHYNLKWFESQKINFKKVNDELLSKKIIDFTRDIYKNLKLDGFVRFDIRMDKNDQLYLLDINTYCGIFYKEGDYGCADYIIYYDIGYEKFIDKLIEYM